MSANSKKRASSPSVSSQGNRSVRHRSSHRRTYSGNSRSPGGQVHLSAIPETGQFTFPEPSAYIDYMADVDSDICPSEAPDRTADALNGRSVFEEDDPDANAIIEASKYFGGAFPVPWNSNCPEWKILHGEHPEGLTETVIGQIRENPRISLIATLGVNTIKKILVVNVTNAARWKADAKSYFDKARESMVKEQALKPVLQEAYDALKEASKNYNALQVQMDTMETSRKSFEEHSKKYEKRAKNVDVVIGVMNWFTATDPGLKVQVSTTKEEMRTLLRLETLDECMQLTRDECVAVLRVMVVVGWDETEAFKKLWTFPPQVKPKRWVAIYGHTANLNTGKGNQSQMQLAHRVAHYLGYGIPPTPTRGVPEVVYAGPDVEDMTRDEIAKQIALLQAKDRELEAADKNNA